MVAYSKVINGITKFVDSEIINKLVGAPRWIIGTISGVALKKANNLYVGLKNNVWIKSMELVNEKDEIDVELIYEELKKQAQKGSIFINIPMAGELTLNEQDVDKLYSFIMGG